MQRHRLFAAGLSAALLLGVATPALAKPGKGNAYGHRNKPAKEAKPAKPPKAPKPTGRVNGGGFTANGVEFSVQGKAGKLKQAHFNYTAVDGSIKVRCKGFEMMSPVVYITAGPPAMYVEADCFAKGPGKTRTPVRLSATFVDNVPSADDGDVSNDDPTTVVTGAADEAHISLSNADGTAFAPADNGPVKGEINVRY